MIFLNSVEPSTVTVDATERGTWMVRGLPSLRVGTWNGNEFTADDLAAMTAAFGTAQAGGFEPGLWPRHNYDHQGNVMPQDAGAALGFYKALRFDAERGLLLGDIEVFDEQTARDMERGRLRYVSAEVVRGDDGPSLTGAAFVPDPAVKGMPWQLVINAADYSTMQNAQQEGGETMNPFIAKLKAILSGEADVSTLDDLATDEEPTPDADDEPVDDADDVTALQAAHISALQAEVEALKADVLAAKQERLEAQADARVQKLLGERAVTPATAPYARQLFVAALSEAQPVVVLADDGKTKREVSAADALDALLHETSPGALFGTHAEGLVLMSDAGEQDETEQERQAGLALAAAGGVAIKTNTDGGE